MELHHAGSSSAFADGFGTWHAAEVQWLGSSQVLIEREVFKDVSHEKNPGWLGYIWVILPSYIGIIIHH